MSHSLLRTLKVLDCMSRSHRSTINRIKTKRLFPATCTSSNYESTATDLSARGLNAMRVPRSTSVKTDGFVHMPFFNQVFDKVGESYDKLIKLIDEPHDGEREFGGALFTAFAECMNKKVHGFKGKPQRIIFEDEDCIVKKGNMEYTMGIASQVHSSQLRITTDDIGYKDRIHDHCCVIFERIWTQEGTAEYQVRDMFATVEIKMDNTNCSSFETIDMSDDIDNRLIKLSTKHGPLAQAILYVLTDVMPCKARLGLELQSLPFAVIAGKKKGYRGSKRVCYVHGNVLVPEKCGDGFSYGVCDYGTFDEPNHASAAVATYLSVMTDGLVAARVALDNLKSGNDVMTKPVSGQQLYFGDVHLKKMRLLASPIPVPASSKSDHDVSLSKPRPSQGELFEGIVKFTDFSSSTNNEMLWCEGFFNDNEEKQVLVKVTSRACHELLTPLYESFLWKVDSDSHVWKEVKDILSHSLYGVCRYGSHGMVQMMPDLRKKGFRPLCPCDESMSKVWMAFKNFVNNTLVPLANAGLIHPDIRPGYDFTANILYCDNGEDGASEMRMIDLDSICLGKGFLDEEFLNTNCPSEARRYVFWQCVTMACYLKFKISGKVNAITVMRMLQIKDVEKFQSKFHIHGIPEEFRSKINRLDAMHDQDDQLQQLLSFLNSLFLE